MSRPRLGRRVIAAAIAAPVLLIGAPLLGTAHAAINVVLSEPTIPNTRTVGPNAGFLDPTQGVLGTTPAMRFTLNDVTAQISSLTVGVAGPSISIFRDFNSGDGLAIYKDASNDGLFTEALEYAAGPVSNGFTIGTAVAGVTPVTISATAAAANSPSYFLTVRPRDGVLVGNRAFTLSIPANGIVTSLGNGPGTAFPGTAITIDSFPARTPSNGNFTRVQNIAGVEDGYNATTGEAASEPGQKLLFLNSNSKSIGSVLVRPTAAKAIFDPPGAATTLFPIGDGTGRTATVGTALNNQTSDNVFVASLDTMGNLSPRVQLVASGLPGPTQVLRTNDVTAPTFTALNARMCSPDASDTTGCKDIAAINLSNYHSVPIQLTGSGLAGGATQAQVRLTLLDGAGNPTNASSPWQTVAISVPQQQAGSYTINTSIDSSTMSNDNAFVIAQTRILDGLNNASDIVAGLQKGVSEAIGVLKDITPPTLLSVSPFRGNADYPSYIVRFSEDIAPSSIVPSDWQFAPGTTPNDPHNVENALKPTSPGAGPPSPTWGLIPGWSWLSSTAGEVRVDDPANPITQRKATLGDTINTSNGAIIDLAGNKVVNQTLIRFIGPVPFTATTVDDVVTVPKLFNQANDGVLDAIQVTLTEAIDPTSIAAAFANFRVELGTVSLPPTAVTVVGTDNKTLRIAFTPQFTSGDRPVLKLNLGGGGITGLKAAIPVAPGGDVEPFLISPGDGVQPILLTAVTRDDDFNGQVDHADLTFSEPINRGRIGTNGFRVPGFEDQGPDVVGCDNVDDDPTACSNSTTAPTTAGPTVKINLLPHTTPDTGLNLQSFSYNAARNAPVCCIIFPSIYDTTGNEQATLSGILGDGAGPFPLSRRTWDDNTDGRVDSVLVKYSEPLSTASIPNAQFEVTDRTFLGSFPFDGDTSNETVRVGLNEVPAPGQGDTDSLVDIQYNGGVDGGLKDASLNVNPAKEETKTTKTTDGAGPAILSASATFDGNPPNPSKMKVIFSESSAGVTGDDFTVSQLPSYEQEPTAAALATDGKSAVLDLPPGYDPGKDGTVELGGVGLINDKAVPPNSNTQITPVLAPATPVVSLLPTGPAGSAAGYTTSALINTGAAGSASVTKWLLQVWPTSQATPAPPADATDARFSTTRPDTVTLPGNPVLEGPYNLRLYGADSFGNMSAPATASITYDFSGPAIDTMTVENITSNVPNSVRDNDTARLVALVRGGDVSGLPKENFTADFSQITNDTADSEMHPVALDNQSTTTRSAEFSFRKATGTTIYPVGTVLRMAGDSGPAYLIKDGSPGTIMKSQFLSETAMLTHGYTNPVAITVPAAVLTRLFTAPTTLYREGALVRANGRPEVYVIFDGQKHHVTAGQFTAMGYQFKNVYVVGAFEVDGVPTGAPLAGAQHPVGSYVKFPNGRTDLIIKKSDGTLVRRHVISYPALLSRIKPTEVVNINSADQAITDDGGIVTIRDGSLINHPGDGRTFVVSRGIQRHIVDANVFSRMGWSFSNLKKLSVNETQTPDGPVVGTRQLQVTLTVKDGPGNITTKSLAVTALGTPDVLS